MPPPLVSLSRCLKFSYVTNNNVFVCLVLIPLMTMKFATCNSSFGDVLDADSGKLNCRCWCLIIASSFLVFGQPELKGEIMPGHV